MRGISNIMIRIVRGAFKNYLADFFRYFQDIQDIQDIQDTHKVIERLQLLAPRLGR